LDDLTTVTMRSEGGLAGYEINDDGSVDLSPHCGVRIYLDDLLDL
jgi:hypothetical protein